MTAEDKKNDNETSLSVALTETGVEAKAKSRFIAAIDRLFGSVADWARSHIDARTEVRNAKTRGEVQLIETVTQYGVEKLGADPDRAERAFDRHFRKVLSEQENLDAVVREAADNLKISPPTETQSNDERTLSQEFLDRFETYAATASTDELRQRWGRVLASEVKTPGTFSPKVLRVVDELDSKAALLFENVSRNSIDGVIPICLSGELPYSSTRSLVNAGLIEDPGFEGQIRMFRQLSANDGELHFVLPFSKGAVVIPVTEIKIRKGFALPSKAAAVVVNGDKGIAVPAYLMTDVGRDIVSILPDLGEGVLRRLFDAIAGEITDVLDASWMRLYFGDDLSSLRFDTEITLPLKRDDE
ncbi:DUF2806 domain-containing protein [Shinella sp. 838]|uniref:DUF2806 domain-containing protein n=1 Tax=Shinella sp. 838 TaxID=3038164 RepID=UPI00241581AE|nr:DUF2806 domain-containing protein [Shinella sp. 838]MDG4676174.1 DUF2806 domain-containing protein [Shinella sp. 838]